MTVDMQGEDWPVLVGVDGSEGLLQFLEGSRLRVGLVAVHCLEQLAPIYDVPVDDSGQAAAMRELLDNAVAARQHIYPEVRCETKVVPGAPGRMLTDLSRQALLLVVGSHGSGGFRGMLLGSVSQQVLHHAAAPVAIVRGSRSATSAGDV